MGRIKDKRPSPAMVVAITALVFAVAGSAVAGIATVSVLSKKEKKQTRNIAKGEINKAAPGLSVANAGQLGGTGASGYMRFGGTIPSGATVTGAFTSADRDDISAFARGGESFPLPAPADLTDSQVNFSSSTVASDDDPACTGSFNVPTAPPGKVCLYHGSGNYQDATASGVSLGGGGLQSRYGFGIEGPAFPGFPGQAYIRGTWAYTAP